MRDAPSCGLVVPEMICRQVRVANIRPALGKSGGSFPSSRRALSIKELTAAVEHEANRRPEVVQLMTHPGVGPITGLAYVLVIGTPGRFPCGKQIGSYTGLIPCEDSSAGKQRLGHISKQGNSLLRFLLVEASQAAARCNPDWRRRYMHLMMRREKRIAKVAMARKLAVRLYWMWRLCFMRHGRHYAALRNMPRECAVTRVRGDLRVQDAA
jgi:hypothetical protein